MSQFEYIVTDESVSTRCSSCGQSVHVVVDEASLYTL